MKKRILIFISILIVSVFVFSGCTESLSQNARISELRTDILTGENNEYKIVTVTGVREDPFNIDGVSQSEKVYFTVITVTPSVYNPLSEYDFNVTIGGQAISGKLVRHPFNETYSAEINKLTEESELTVEVNSGSQNSSVVVKTVKTENFIDADKAFSIGEKRLNDKISSKNCDYEIFVRLIENPINTDGGYYWYVAFIFQDDTTCSVLINPVTMDIESVRD